MLQMRETCPLSGSGCIERTSIHTKPLLVVWRPSPGQLSVGAFQTQAYTFSKVSSRAGHAFQNRNLAAPGYLGPW